MISQRPLISVIMPCYNAAHVIEKTINDLYQQSLQDFELIVINDGSTDDSLQLLLALSKKYISLKIIDQPNSGPGPARNSGLNVAQGDFIAFLDADDSWHKDCLLKLYQGLLNAPGCVLAYCGWQNIGLSTNLCQPYIPPDYETNDKLSRLLRSCPWPIHAALTYRSAIENVNRFNEKWLTSEDFDMWLRIAAFQKIIRIPEVLAYYHHQQGEQISKNKLRAILNHWGVQKAFLDDFPQIYQSLGLTKVICLTEGELLNRAYESFWQGDLTTAHTLFRKLLMSGHVQFKDLKYILLSLLPLPAYCFLIKKLRK